MIDVERYLAVPYVDGGRTMQGGDCWFFVLSVRADLGLPPLPPLHSTTRHTPLAMAHEYEQVSGTLEQCEPQVGAVAAVFRGRLMVHVGIVLEIDGRLAVLETNPGSGPRWLRVRDFVERYYRVIFYRDSNLPEQAQPRL